MKLDKHDFSITRAFTAKDARDAKERQEQ